MGVQRIKRTSKSFYLTQAGEAFYLKVCAGELLAVLPRPIDWKIGVFYLRDGYRFFASVKLYDFIVFQKAVRSKYFEII